MVSLELFDVVVEFSIVKIVVIITTIIAIITTIIAILNYQKKKIKSLNFNNCTFTIQSMNPVELNDKNVVNRISDCINKNVPKIAGQIEKDTKIKLKKNEIDFLNVIDEKVEEYSKISGNIIKNANILRILGNKAYYLGKSEKALEHYKQALEIDEELKDIKSKAIDLNNINNKRIQLKSFF